MNYAMQTKVKCSTCNYSQLHQTHNVAYAPIFHPRPCESNRATVRIASRNDWGAAFAARDQSIRSSLISTASVGSRKVSLTYTDSDLFSRRCRRRMMAKPATISRLVAGSGTEFSTRSKLYGKVPLKPSWIQNV
jgi:hypothetical protein